MKLSARCIAIMGVHANADGKDAEYYNSQREAIVAGLGDIEKAALQAELQGIEERMCTYAALYTELAANARAGLRAINAPRPMTPAELSWASMRHLALETTDASIEAELAALGLASQNPDDNVPY